MSILDRFTKKKKTKSKEVSKVMAKRKSETIEVKVSRAGTSFIKTVTLNGNRSVSDALRAAGIAQKDAENVLVNNEEVNDVRKYQLEEGDKIVLVKDVEGGAF